MQHGRVSLLALVKDLTASRRSAAITVSQKRSCGVSELFTLQFKHTSLERVPTNENGYNPESKVKLVTFNLKVILAISIL
jgi:hypothetical protein